LSGDEITFGEMSVREPERRQRPDRDRRLACLAYEVPGPADLPIFLDKRAADAIERHALSDTSVELGGILLGKECVDQQTNQPFVWIAHALEAKHYANTQASFTYTHDSWEEITRHRDQKFPDFDIVGWYHTHPSFGIFLSHHDLFIHEHFFSQPLQVAYVVDPINQTRGFFQWRSGAMAQVGGFYLSADRDDRVALARLVNDLEQVSNSEANSGGTFSPRLEAELINMLSRPAIHRDTTNPIERAQLAAVFGLIGAVLGMFLVALAFWLYQIHERLQEQAQSYSALSRLVEQTATGQRLMGDVFLEKVSGQKPLNFESLYEKATQARDEMERKLGAERTINESLAREHQALINDYDTNRKALARAEKDAKDAPKLRERNAKLEAENLVHTAKLDAIAPFVESPEGKKALAVQEELVRTRYAAISGWGCSALFCAGLVALYFYFKPLAEDVPDTADRPSHRIE
jgi:proteasome lid subunit RPN8/RPN11